MRRNLQAQVIHQTGEPWSRGAAERCKVAAARAEALRRPGLRNGWRRGWRAGRPAMNDNGVGAGSHGSKPWKPWKSAFRLRRSLRVVYRHHAFPRVSNLGLIIPIKSRE